MNLEEAREFLRSRQSQAKDWKALAEKITRALDDYDVAPSVEKWKAILTIRLEILE